MNPSRNTQSKWTDWFISQFRKMNMWKWSFLTIRVSLPFLHLIWALIFTSKDTTYQIRWTHTIIFSLRSHLGRCTHKRQNRKRLITEVGGAEGVTILNHSLLPFFFTRWFGIIHHIRGKSCNASCAASGCNSAVCALHVCGYRGHIRNLCF